MVTGRIHRMTELFGKLAPGATLDDARNELRTVYASMVKDHPDAYPDNGGYRIDARMLRDEITSGARTILLVLLASLRPGLHHRLFERGQSDFGAHGSPRGRTWRSVPRWALALGRCAACC